MFDAGAIVFSIRAAGAALFRQEMTEAGKATEELGKSTESAKEKTEELGEKQETAAQKARRLAQEQAAAEKAAREYADAQSHVGAVLVTAGAAIVATTGLTVKAAIDWQSAWAGVTKTVEGTPEELSEVEDGLRALTGVLPAAHGEIAAVAEAAGQLGVKTEDVVGFTRTMIDLGETTNLSSDQAATSIAQLMNIMGTAGEDVSRLGSTIVALGNDGASTEAEIVSMAQRIAGSGKLVGATEGEVLALANALASMGVTAELGGGVASRILQDLYSAVETGGERLDAFAAVAGTSADDFATAFRNDPVRAMGEFATGLNGVEASGGNVVQTLADLGFKSTEEQRVLLQLKSAGDLLTDSLDLQNTAWQENSALQTEAAKRYETVESQLGIMRNQINDAAIDLGSVFLPVIAEVASGIGDFASGIASLPEPLQGAIAVGGLLIGVVALLGGTAMIAVPKVLALRREIILLTASGTAGGTALRGIASFLTGPWGIAIAAAITAGALLTAWLDSTRASSEELTAAFGATSRSAESMWATTGKGFKLGNIGFATAELSELSNVIEHLDGNSANFFSYFFASDAVRLTGDRLMDVGNQLAVIAKTDINSALDSMQMLAEHTDGSEEALWGLINSLGGDFKSALIAAATAAGDYSEDMSEAEKKTALLEYAQKQSADQSQTAAEAYVEAADGAAQLRDDLDQLLSLLNEANEVGQDAITANLDYKDALADVDEQIQKARDGVEGYALGLDDTTQSGRDNMRMLQDLAADAWSVVEADLAHGASIDDVKAKLVGSREDLIQRARDFGYTADEALALADEILRIPPETEWAIIADTQTAQLQIDSYISKNTGREILVKINGVQVGQGLGGSGGLVMADGGVVSYHANGSVSEHHVAQIARAGEYRVWAEPETEGEAYIPLAKSKRSRSEAIMAETAERMGGVFIPANARPYANGSPLAGTPGASTGITYTGDINVLLPAADPEIAAVLFADKLRDGFAAS